MEESLERLGVDKIQMLHLHDPEHCVDINEITGKGGALEELVKMKEEGLADAIGLAMGTVDMMFDILKQGWPFDTIINHNRYTLLNRNADEMFTWAHEKGIAIFNAAPYASGVLAKGSDKMPLIAYVPASDEDLEPVRAIEATCADHGIATGPAALHPRLGPDPDPRRRMVGTFGPALFHGRPRGETRIQAGLTPFWEVSVRSFTAGEANDIADDLRHGTGRALKLGEFDGFRAAFMIPSRPDGCTSAGRQRQQRQRVDSTW